MPFRHLSEFLDLSLRLFYQLAHSLVVHLLLGSLCTTLKVLSHRALVVKRTSRRVSVEVAVGNKATLLRHLVLASLHDHALTRLRYRLLQLLLFLF